MDDDVSLRDWQAVLAEDLADLLASSSALSWGVHGRKVSFFVRGTSDWETRSGERVRGGFPTLSITGSKCSLSCDHCRGLLLPTMKPAEDPSGLLELAKRLEREGNVGMLVSGGCRPDGTLPWEDFSEALREVKEGTGLVVSVHTGFVEKEQAEALHLAGVDEVLIDVVGSETTLRDVYHIHGDGALKRMWRSLDLLSSTGIPLVPHILVGLHHGEIRGEMAALGMCAERDIAGLVVIALMPQKGTPMEGVAPPTPETVARFICAARLAMPRAPIALGCARPKPPVRGPMDRLALKAGVNRIAAPTGEAEIEAAALGLEVRYERTCCSASFLY